MLTKQTTLVYAGEWTSIITKVSCVINERNNEKISLGTHEKSIHYFVVSAGDVASVSNGSVNSKPSMFQPSGRLVPKHHTVNGKGNSFSHLQLFFNVS